MTLRIGALEGQPVTERSDLIAPVTARALEVGQLAGAIEVVGIDPDLSDTAATKAAYALSERSLANCVIVGGRRDGEERIGACVVLASDRADINGRVRRLLDVRKASFLSKERAVELSGMEYGAITPVGLPESWPLFVDDAVIAQPVIVLGSGLRRSKLLMAGQVLATLAASQVVAGLGIPTEGDAAAHR